MALQNFVDRVGPVVYAVWLNAVDLLRNAMSATSTGSVTVPFSVQVGAPTGGDKGVGSLNAQTLYIQGVLVSPTGSPPGGSTTQVQYNNAGAFGGASITYNSAIKQYSIPAATGNNTTMIIDGAGGQGALDLTWTSNSMSLLIAGGAGFSTGSTMSLYATGGPLYLGTGDTNDVYIATHGSNRLHITSAGGAIFGAATGGDQGIGTINAVGLYVNGVAVPGLASPAFTGTPTAPTATAGTNTTQLATTAFVHAALDPGHSAATNGDMELPNGMIIQWGYISTTGSATFVTQNFAIPFPTACLNVSITHASTSATAAGASNTGLAVNNLTTTGFDWVASTTANTTGFYYMAIGN